MLAQLEKFLAEIPKPNEKICFAMGFDCEMNGADEKNCHFSLFSSPENTKAWEAGKEKARLTKRALDAAKAAAQGASSAGNVSQGTPRQ